MTRYYPLTGLYAVFSVLYLVLTISLPYIIIWLIALSYGLISRGARNLKRIESL